MTQWNEKVHGYLIALFYKNLKLAYGQQGIDCFVKATQHFAEQRGKRMAMAALRDGYPLDYNAYMAYSELSPVIGNTVDVEQSNKDVIFNIRACPWHDIFEEMGLLDCGMVYCKEIDKGLVRGFNPALEFSLNSVLHNSPCCTMVFKEALGGKPIENNVSVKKDWGYHCGHIYKVYSNYALTVFPDGAKVINQVDCQFSEQFGADTLTKLKEYSLQDFDRLS